MEDKSKNCGVIIGATGFLGYNLAHFFAKNGFDLILVSRNRKKVKILKQEIESKYRKKVQIIVQNLTKVNINKIKKNIKKFDEKINFLIITSADQKPIGNFIDTKIKDWIQNININVISTIKLVQFFTKFFSDHNSNSSIILFSGGGGTSSRPGFSAYATSKTALIRFTEIVALEIKNKGINLNIISPGVMPSQMILEIIKNENKLNKSEVTKAKQILDSNESNLTETLELCKFLISEEGNKITGRIISSKWDNWQNWSNNLDDLEHSDLYTLRRITGKDRNINWGDKNI